MGHILILHPNKSLHEKLGNIIEDQGHWVIHETSPLVTEQRINTHHPEILFLSTHSLGNNPLEFINTFKSLARHRLLSFVLLSPADKVSEEIDALTQKSVHGILSDENLNEMEIRNTIQNLLTHTAAKKISKRFLTYELMVLDRDSRTVRLGAALASDLPQKPFDLLWHITKKSPEVSSRSFLISKIWETQVRDREVDVLISRLKSKVPFIVEFIESVPGKGYRLSPPTLSKKQTSQR